MKKPARHILGLSGGKDSTALAIYMAQKRKVKDMEYFFCDTGCELPETYEFLERLKARLGITITILKSKLSFDELLYGRFNGFLPSLQSRWCTAQLKIEPIEKWIGKDEAISYIGIRADEDREGYISSADNINPQYPFKEDGLRKADIMKLLEESGIGMPKYYEWRSRSGCYFCFFQRKYEWVMLAKRHPDLFQKAVSFETSHEDGRQFYWHQNESLMQILSDKDRVIAGYAAARRKKTKSKDKLFDILTDLFDGEDSERCSVCHL